jgi:hypothetical protein
MEKCSEGGEGVVVKVSSTNLPENVSRCTCIECPAKSCLRLLSYLKEMNSLNPNSIYAKFCGNLTLNPVTDCNYYLNEG